MSRAQDLARLGALAGMIRDARLAGLRAADAECADLRAQIARLDRARQQVTGAEILLTAPAYLVWQQRARASLNTRLAAALAREEQARIAARRAFGRAEVLARLEGARAGAGKRSDQAS
jgi:hypothetical protein